MRAYADWRHFPDYQDAVIRLGIEARQSPSYRYQGKNATDVQMAIEATDLVHTRPELEVFILLSGDSDFTPLVHLLHERGRKVVGTGASGAVSRHLEAVCDEFVLYDALVAASAGAGETAEDATGSGNGSAEVRRRERSVRHSGANDYGNGHSGRDAGFDLAACRDALAIDRDETLTASRWKKLLVHAQEAGQEAHARHAASLKRALLRRFPGELSMFEATIVASVLEKTDGLGPGGWLYAASGDGELLFDLLLYAARRSLESRGFDAVDSPERLGRILLRDRLQASEIRMRILRGRKTLERQQQQP